MAFGRLERTARPQPMGEINMTPLIDVMLVLLVIFMVTAPLMGSSLKLDLPAASAARPGGSPQFIALAIDRDGHLFYGDAPLAQPEFVERLKAAGRFDPQIEVQLRADRGTPYGRVAEVLDWLQQAGLTHIGFVAQQVAGPGAAASAP